MEETKGRAQTIQELQEWGGWAGFRDAMQVVGDLTSELHDLGDHEHAHWLHDVVWRRLRDHPMAIAPYRRT